MSQYASTIALYNYTVWLTVVMINVLRFMVNKSQACTVLLKQSWGRYFKKVASYIHIADYFQKQVLMFYHLKPGAV